MNENHYVMDCARYRPLCLFPRPFGNLGSLKFLKGTLLGTIVCTLHVPFTLKSILRIKKNYGNSNISSCKNIPIFKKSSKRKNPSRYYNSITNLKFQHKPKCHLFKNPHIKIDLLLSPRGQNPLSYYTL
jgi:hypothetical protein